MERFAGAMGGCNARSLVARARGTTQCSREGRRQQEAQSQREGRRRTHVACPRFGRNKAHGHAIILTYGHIRVTRAGTHSEFRS